MSTVIRRTFFFFNDTATTEIYTLSLHDALPILTAWQVAGPYSQTGKNFAALFDLPFSPEQAVEASSKSADENQKVVNWKVPEIAGSSSQKPWVVDLLKILGGEQCVAYARTWIHSDRDQTARLELGSDDGIKVW